jgi:hypothetical protein
VLELTASARTVAEIAKELFGPTGGYHRLLALEEAGAYVEYLHQRGSLGIPDFERMEQEQPGPVRYQRLEGETDQVLDLAAASAEIGEPNLRI